MTHAPQHLVSSDEQHPSHCLSVGLNSDEEESQLPDEYYRACAVVDRDDFFVKFARTTNLAQRQTQCWCKTLVIN